MQFCFQSICGDGCVLMDVFIIVCRLYANFKNKSIEHLLYIIEEGKETFQLLRYTHL